MNKLQSDTTNVSDLSRIMSELSLTTTSTESKAMIPNINHLPELDSITDDALLQVFWENRDTIFSYARVDIENTLVKRDLEVLKSIRIKLCEIVGQLFQNYSGKIPINRKVKNKVVNDIFNLGFSIINKNVTKEMENVYQKDSSVPEGNIDSDDKAVSDLAQLIAQVANMRNDIDKNSKEISKLRAEKQELAEKLMSSCCKCGDKTPTVQPKAADKQKPITNILGLNNNSANSSVFDIAHFSQPASSAAQQSRSLTSKDNLLSLKNPKVTVRKLRESTTSESSSSADSSDSAPKHIRKAYRKMKNERKGKQVRPISNANPIKTAIMPDRKVDMYIGCIDESNIAEDLIAHMKTFDIVIGPSEISEIAQRSENKAFKVKLAKSYVAALKVIWPEGVIVDKYRPPKKVGMSVKPNKYHKTDSHNPNNITAKKDQPFRSPSWQARSSFRDWDNWRFDSQDWPALPRSYYTHNNSWERSRQAPYEHPETPYYNSYY